MLKFSAKVMVVFVIVAAAAAAWWNTQRVAQEPLRSSTDWRSDAAPERTLLR